jgi:hypothetical protein
VPRRGVDGRGRHEPIAPTLPTGHVVGRTSFKPTPHAKRTALQRHGTRSMDFDASAGIARHAGAATGRLGQQQKVVGRRGAQVGRHHPTRQFHPLNRCAGRVGADDCPVDLHRCPPFFRVVERRHRAHARAAFSGSGPGLVST